MFSFAFLDNRKVKPAVYFTQLTVTDVLIGQKHTIIEIHIKFTVVVAVSSPDNPPQLGQPPKKLLNRYSKLCQFCILFMITNGTYSSFDENSPDFWSV